ncbi:MAG: RNA methyltransferase [Candidatus Aminicenantes bacterium]|nr:RNA methyltransferase [Candidatus Aminicenantes bacterium]
MIRQISSRSNPRIKSLLAEKEDYFFFEGEKLVRDILRKKIPVHRLIINNTQESKLKIPPRQVEEVWLVNQSILKKLSSLKEKSDFMAVVKYQPKKVHLEKESLIIALDTVQDPSNAGTIFRCAAAFGIHSLLFSGDCVKINNPKFIRAAQASLFEVNFHHFPDIHTLIKQAQTHHIHVYLTASKTVSRNVNYSDIQPPAMIIFGNEGQGLPGDLFAQFPCLRIPHKNCVESLNVGISACIIMNELKNKFNL